MAFLDRLGKEILICDGGMGTMLQAKGLKAGEAPETLNFSHPDWVQDVHAQYLAAGADIIETNTFGANPVKLESGDVRETVLAACRIAREAVNGCGREAYVALSCGPTGKLLAPYGTLPFADAVECYRTVMAAAEESEADLIIVETMSDLYEARAALLAAREKTGKPVILSVTMGQNGRTLTGADVKTAAVLAESFGCCAVSLNCGLGPKQLTPLIAQLSKCAGIPVMVNSNAGLPRIENGETVFDVGPAEFAGDAMILAESGAVIVGGCCGTNPGHIREVKNALAGLAPAAVCGESAPCISTGAKTLILDDGLEIGILSPETPAIKQALEDEDYESVADEAFELDDSDAFYLTCDGADVGADALACMAETVLSQLAKPLILDSADPDALEAAAFRCNGRPAIVYRGEDSVRIAGKYGAVLVVRTGDEAPACEGIDIVTEGKTFPVL